jgi:hypothetical protein
MRPSFEKKSSSVIILGEFVRKDQANIIEWTLRVNRILLPIHSEVARLNRRDE